MPYRYDLCLCCGVASYCFDDEHCWRCGYSRRVLSLGQIVMANVCLVLLAVGAAGVWVGEVTAVLPFWVGSPRALAAVCLIALLALLTPIVVQLIRFRPMGHPAPSARPRRRPGAPSAFRAGRRGNRRARGRHPTWDKRKRTARF